MNLPIYAVKDSIDSFATSKSDIQKDRIVMPHEKTRVKSEDIYPEDPVAAAKALEAAMAKGP